MTGTEADDEDAPTRLAEHATTQVPQSCALPEAAITS